MIKRAGLVIIVLFLTLLSPVLVHGQAVGSITVSGSTVQVSYPLAIKFSAQVKSSSTVTDIRLCYQIEQMSFARAYSEVFIDFTPSGLVNAAYTLDLRKLGAGGVPPGTYLNYWWKAENQSGAAVETPPERYQVNDNLHKWQNLTEGKVAVYYYSGGESLARSVMSVAQQSLTKLSADTGAVPEKTISIYAYETANDFHNSVVFEQEWSGGVSFSDFNTISIIIRPGQLSTDLSGIPHELTHAVIHQVTANPYNGIPLWLNEGLAMHSEGLLGPQFTGPLSRAIREDRLISVRSLSAPFSAVGDQAYLSYAQSFSLVDYLIGQYGPNKMLDLLLSFKEGIEWDAALRKVYGFDMDGLDRLWRPWVTEMYRQG